MGGGPATRNGSSVGIDAMIGGPGTESVCGVTSSFRGLPGGGGVVGARGENVYCSCLISASVLVVSWWGVSFHGL